MANNMVYRISFSPLDWPPAEMLAADGGFTSLLISKK
jgi:hypothetical protein